MDKNNKSIDPVKRVDKNSGETWIIAFLDMLLIIVLILMVLISPPKKEDKANPPGDLVIEARWADDCDSDVDLWVKGPGTQPAVGFSNSQGKVFNLLRDDLGASGTLDSLNYENIYSRGSPPGEYIVNLHLYTNSLNCSLPMQVSVAVSIRQQSLYLQNIWRGRVLLRFAGDEITAIRFTVNEKGKIDHASINFLNEKISPVIIQDAHP